jgi:hypothetical protein
MRCNKLSHSLQQKRLLPPVHKQSLQLQPSYVKMAMSQDLSDGPHELQNPIGRYTHSPFRAKLIVVSDDSLISKDDLWDDRNADTLSLRERYMMAKTEQIHHETRVEDATAALRRRVMNDLTTQLGDIRGEWILYSSQHLDIYANKPEPEIDGTEWNAGTLTIGEEYMDQWARDCDADVGIEVDFIDGPLEGYHITPKTPRYASTKPITRTARGCEEVFSCDITFLGNGLLEMRIPGHILAKDCGHGLPELYFVGVLKKDLAQLEHHARRMSSEWKNCPYTGHFHPDNDMKTKLLIQRQDRASGRGMPLNSMNRGIKDDDGWETDSDEADESESGDE